jgi:hypothetical protein
LEGMDPSETTRIFIVGKLVYSVLKIIRIYELPGYGFCFEQYKVHDYYTERSEIL